MHPRTSDCHRRQWKPSDLHCWPHRRTELSSWRRYRQTSRLSSPISQNVLQVSCYNSNHASRLNRSQSFSYWPEPIRNRFPRLRRLHQLRVPPAVPERHLMMKPNLLLRTQLLMSIFKIITWIQGGFAAPTTQRRRVPRALPAPRPLWRHPHRMTTITLAYVPTTAHCIDPSTGVSTASEMVE